MPTGIPGPSFGRGNANASRTTNEWVEEVFIDYGPAAANAGPGPEPTEESNRYSLTQGGIRWFDGDPVEYAIDGGSGAENTEVVAAISTWDGFVTTRAFTRNDATTMENPCRDGEPNQVVWDEIDGEGGILAQTSACRNVATKEIRGFIIIMDTAEPWTTAANPGNTDLDVQNVAAHEFGHAVGLDHVNGWRNGCLTMYPFAGLGETQKRTLGWGDKLGMHTLYGSSDVTAGACGS